MFYKEIDPGPDLGKLIKCIWALEHDYGGPFHNHEHLWADANGELIFTYGNSYYLETEAGKRILPDRFVIGPFRKGFDLYSQGLTKLVGVRFWPWGMYEFSRRPMADLIDQILPAEEVFGLQIDSLAADLVDKSSEERLALVQAFFRAEVRKGTRRKNTVQAIGSRIISRKGRMTIRELSREFDLSPRRLERTFRSETGLSPKMLSRVVRFNHAKQSIEKDPHISLADLTCEAGFCDQSHFSKTFKEMFGITPGTFKAQMISTKALFAEIKPDVVFLQDS
jgi:AraC-like DNA-binding protein